MPFVDPKSITGLGYRSLLKYIDYHQPELVVAENVGTLVKKRAIDGGRSPIQIQEQAFAQRGFEAFHDVCDSSHFGLRQTRQRCWALYIRGNGFGTLGPN